MASIITADPDALSVAPVPPCHESKCAAEHDDLVGLAGARNFGDDVERRGVVVEGVDDVGLDRDRHLALERPGDAAVVLDGDDDLRQAEILRVRRAVRRGAAEQDVAGIAACVACDQRERPFVLEELRALLGEALRAAATATGPTLPAGTSGATAASDRVGFSPHPGELLVGEAPRNRIPQRVDRAQGLRQHELAAQLPLEPREVFRRLDDGMDRFALHVTAVPGVHAVDMPYTGTSRPASSPA
jgi:hypothetical protein